MIVSSVDKKSVEDLLMSRSFTDTKFIVDRGFFSEAVLTPKFPEALH